MQQKDAIDLINFKGLSSGRQIWTDLGCGNGTFTYALAELLSDESTIYAVDKNKNSLEIISDNYKKIKIIKYQIDFLNFKLPRNLDGILMANSLHYIKNKNKFIKNAYAALKPTGKFLIVEYDTERSNAWIPFPIGFDLLKKLFGDEGFGSVIKLIELQSIFRKEKIYSALISK